MTRMFFSTTLALAALGLGGCYARAVVDPYPATGVVVYQAPPAPQVVVTTPPPAPYQGAIWVEGHWQWNGATYVWLDGHYQQPRAGYVWVQPRWHRRGNGWVYVQGTWRAGGHGHVRPGHHRRHPRGHHRRGGAVVVQPPQAEVNATVQVR